MFTAGTSWVDLFFCHIHLVSMSWRAFTTPGTCHASTLSSLQRCPTAFFGGSVPFQYFWNWHVVLSGNSNNLAQVALMMNLEPLWWSSVLTTEHWLDRKIFYVVINVYALFFIYVYISDLWAWQFNWTIGDEIWGRIWSVREFVITAKICGWNLLCL